tara:strand:- start:10822 stop:13482 length:2661 start_codon:yes stop_codon:yes gene_type:complete
MSSEPTKDLISSDEIREAFLNFYAKKSHKIISSASLIPEDPTVLLTIAGMLPFKSVFLGLKERPADRATSSQKCIRTNDIENVGATARHHTFFEMLGNFSFGNYFKKEAITWAWELVTQIYKLKREHIVISVFYKDQESKKIWQDIIGISPTKIIELDESDNFWSSGITGPCGPCSELYYDFHPERGMEKIDLDDDKRFIEFYNLVFMQYNRDSNGNLTDLQNKNIDTGMGLERMAQILQKKDNNYETDLIFPIIEKVLDIANINYSTANIDQKISLKILGDHTRAIIHLISDGVIASNLGRGYVLRRLLRRMIRHGRLIGIEDIFISKLAEVGIELMKNSYPDLQNNYERIMSEINIEEIKFHQTLDRGEKLVNQLIDSGINLVSGSQAFELYDTYGFPIELTKEILKEKNIEVDLIGFAEEMKKQKERAKASSQNIDLTLKGSIEREVDLVEKTIFEGYNNLHSKGYILAIFVDSNKVERATKGDRVQIVLNKTPFYAESGGQVGDKGLMISDSAEVQVDKVIKKKDVFLHYGTIQKGVIEINQSIETKVDKLTRTKAESNHTATHLLQSALKLLVDNSVSQRGSLVAFNKLRFDFNSPNPVPKNTIIEVENLVNKWILENHPIEVKIMKKQDALDAGALAMFGEKYGDVVRVVDVPGVSMELCGGTHVKSTSALGCFKIISEIGISSGIRRIEALSGQSVLDYFSERNMIINKLTDLLKTNPSQLFERVTSIQSELISKTKEIKKFKSKLAQLQYSNLLSSVDSIGPYQFIISEVDGLEGELLQSAALDLTSKLGEKSAVILVSIPQESEQKLLFSISFGSDLVALGFHAGKLINEMAKICSGGGGGKPNIAQAGAKNTNSIGEALNFGKQYLTKRLDDQSDK